MTSRHAISVDFGRLRQTPTTNIGPYNAYDRLRPQAGCLRQPFEGYILYKPFHVKKTLCSNIYPIKSYQIHIPNVNWTQCEVFHHPAFNFMLGEVIAAIRLESIEELVEGPYLKRSDVGREPVRRPCISSGPSPAMTHAREGSTVDGAHERG